MTSLSDDTKSLLDGLLASVVAEGKISGLSFAVGTAEKEIYVGHAGKKAMHRPSGSVDDDSMYWMCSTAKIVPSIALLQIIEKGLVSYDTPVEEVFPEFHGAVVVTSDGAAPGWKPAENKVLMRHLLNHSSGLSYGIPFYEGADRVESIPWAYQAPAFEGDHTVTKFLSLIKGDYPSIPLAFEPGTSWTYGWGPDICGFVVEKITGMNLQEYCDKYIFGPLNINPIWWYTQRVKDNIVHLSYRNSDGHLVRWANQYGLMEQDTSKSKICFGGGMLYSTAREFLTILRQLLSSKAGRAPNPILTPESIQAIFSHSISDPAAIALEKFLEFPDDLRLQFGYGFCVAQNDWPGRRRKGSGFWYGWAGIYEFVDPVTGIAAVLTTQIVPTRDAEVLALFQRLEEVIYKDVL